MGVLQKNRPAEAARIIALKHGIGLDTALKITESVWQEAHGIIRSLVGHTGWHGMSFSDKSMICQFVVKALLDKKRVGESISKNNSSID